jgi:hypothetical protein
MLVWLGNGAGGGYEADSRISPLDAGLCASCLASGQVQHCCLAAAPMAGVFLLWQRVLHVQCYVH